MTGTFDISTFVLLAQADVWGWWDLVISVGLFASVAMLIVVVFGQGGKVEVSAQRQAALATGHSDRRTVFERPLFQPVMWVLLSLSHHLAIPRAKSWLRRTLVSAGSPEYYTADEYLALSMLTGVVLASVLEFLQLFILDKFSVMAIVIGLVLGIGLTLYQLYAMSDKRLRKINRKIPYSLDLIALAMGAGATFTEAVQTVVSDKSDDPFNVELRTVLAEMDLGTTRRQALKNLGQRVPLDMIQSIVASVIQAEELGTPLADVLHSEATLMRLQRSVYAENAAAIASVRILVPSLLILMSVVLAIFGPFIIQAIQKGGMF